MLRLLIDENVDNRILRGLQLRLPQLDFLLAKQVGLAGFADSVFLEWAAQDQRTILTHDVKTMPHFSGLRLRSSLSMAGVIVIPDQMRIGRAIKELELLILTHSQSDFRDRIEYLPLRRIHQAAVSYSVRSRSRMKSITPRACSRFTVGKSARKTSRLSPAFK